MGVSLVDWFTVIFNERIGDIERHYVAASRAECRVKS